MRTVTIILTGCLLAVAAGCNSAASRASLTKEINTLKQDKTQLTRQFEQSKSENEQLKEHIQVLSGLPPEVNLEKLDRLQSIKISGYTNIYDKDKDGTKEMLVVYVQPIDHDGDIIKAAGAVDVRLWDLNKNNGQALLGQWHFEPGDLKKLWFTKFITVSYRLMFDVTDKINEYEEPLTVNVTFTDYLTGKVFKEQKVIKPL
ncbi:MAG: hypothetical protein ACYTEO_12235 [Planctomycetota bacterium]